MSRKWRLLAQELQKRADQQSGNWIDPERRKADLARDIELMRVHAQRRRADKRVGADELGALHNTGLSRAVTEATKDRGEDREVLVDRERGVYVAGNVLFSTSRRSWAARHYIRTEQRHHTSQTQEKSSSLTPVRQHTHAMDRRIFLVLVLHFERMTRTRRGKSHGESCSLLFLANRVCVGSNDPVVFVESDISLLTKF